MTLKTRLHTYKFDIGNEDEAAEYEALRAKLRKTNGECFNVYADTRKRDRPEAGPVELETEHLFSNQWNSTTHRLFDWYEGIVPNARIKEGHWLEITKEMREIRRATLVCGYCGKHESIEGATETGGFCDKCLDSEFLKGAELHLLRLLPVELHMPTRVTLTDEERETLMPLYVKRQTTGEDSRNVRKLKKQRTAIQAKREKTINAANTEADGLTWLMDNNLSIDNVIYYDRRGVFTFGWRQPVSDEVASAVLDKISEFPFDYEIKGESRNYPTD